MPTENSCPTHPVGVWVRSRYQAPWVGQVAVSGRDFPPGGVWVTRSGAAVRNGDEGVVPARPYPVHHLPSPGDVLVRFTHNRHGRPMRTRQWKVLPSESLELTTRPGDPS